MAELDTFLLPDVRKEVRQFFENPLETVWVWPCTNFIPPNARQVQDELCTANQDVARKVQAILDAGFHFTSELLRSVDQMVVYITGPCQDSEEDGVEEGDAALVYHGPGKGFFDAVDKMIRDFRIPEDGIHRRWK